MHHKVTTGRSTIFYIKLIGGSLKFFLPYDERAGWNMVLCYEVPVRRCWGLLQPRPPSCSLVQRRTVVHINSRSDLKRAVYQCWSLPNPRSPGCRIHILLSLHVWMHWSLPWNQNLKIWMRTVKWLEVNGNEK